MPATQSHPDPNPPREPATDLAFTLIIPAYNESQRLPPYLETIRPYTDRCYADNYEVIVVDDGSSDQLEKTLAELTQAWPQLHVLRHERNLGKGAAVRTGVMAARGQRLLYADADGATSIEEERDLRAALDAGADLAVGSRLVAGQGVVRNRSWHRALIGRLFALVAHLLLPIPVRDTQCGFKMLRCGPARRLFGLSQERGYLFDLEILALAAHCGYCVTEVPISWSDRPGSRLKLHREGGKILTGLWRIRRRLSRVRRCMIGERTPDTGQ